MGQSKPLADAEVWIAWAECQKMPLGEITVPDDEKLDFDDLKLPEDDATFDDDLVSDQADTDFISASSDSAPQAGPAETEKTTELNQVANQDGKKISLFNRLSEASPYTLMLGLSLGAILIATFFLIIELALYSFDVSAEDGRKGVTRTPAAQLKTLCDVNETSAHV